MKRFLFAALFATSAFFAGCSSLENPFAGFFHTGHDARVYNSQTGQFEWPEEKKPRQSRKSAEVAAALTATPAPQGRGDGRYYDAQKGQWVDPKPESVASSSGRPKSTPRPAVTAAGSIPPPAPTPTPPARATGYYNSSTGKIEWGPGALTTAAAATPPPERSKHWWWPF